jgi:predicted dithiol-disulfide oxidoreductase (DUF899 family)
MYIQIYIYYTYKYTIQVSQISAAPQTTLKKLKISFGWQVLVLENLENAARTSTFRAAICLKRNCLEGSSSVLNFNFKRNVVIGVSELA